MGDVKKTQCRVFNNRRQAAAPAGPERRNKRASCSLRAAACTVAALLTYLGGEEEGVVGGPGLGAPRVGGAGRSPGCLLAVGPAIHSDRCQEASATLRHRRCSLVCVTSNEKADGGRCRSSTSLTFSIPPSGNRSNGNISSAVDCELRSKPKLTF